MVNLKSKLIIFLLSFGGLTLGSVTTFLLTACEALQESHELIAEANQVDDLILSGDAGIVITSVYHTLEERQVLEQALGEYIAFRNKWRAFLDRDTLPEAILDTSFAEFEPDFDKLLVEYERVRQLVVKKWDEYTTVDQRILGSYNRLAQAYRDDVKNLIRAGNENKAVFSALEFGRTLSNVISR